MTEWRAGVWLCLVSKDGTAFLHRATPLSDPEVIEDELIQICQVRIPITAFQVHSLPGVSKDLLWGYEELVYDKFACVPALHTLSLHMSMQQQTLQADGLTVERSR